MSGVVRQERPRAAVWARWRWGLVIPLLATGLAGCVSDVLPQAPQTSASSRRQPAAADSDATSAYAATHSIDQPIATKPSNITLFFSNVTPDGQTDMSSWAPTQRKSEATTASATTAEAASMTPTASASMSAAGDALTSFAPTRQADASDEKPSAFTQFLQGATSNILPPEPTVAPASMQKPEPVQSAPVPVLEPTPPSRGPAEYIR